MVVSVAEDSSGKDGLLEKLKVATRSWGHSPHSMQRGTEARTVPESSLQPMHAADAEHQYFTRKPLLAPGA